MLIVPPGGFAGYAQMTPASRAALAPRGATTSTRRRRRKATTTRKRTTRGKSAKRGGGRKIKFGSPAFHKKYGAKMRRNAKKARK